VYRYDGSREFKHQKISTDEMPMEQDRKRAEKRMEDNFAKYWSCRAGFTRKRRRP
jgi:hypothetical protein